MISIDQNCHSLWDTVPKLHALARRGHAVTHYIEDIDVAFTALGAADDEPLRLDRERYHHSGGAWWGAALFYWEFLGRLPVDLRRWEPVTGMKTAALARQLGRSLEDLYAEFSPSDNWQLVGPSYVGDSEHHRVIGDLTVTETAGFVRELFDKALADMQRAFPARDSRERLMEWLGAERRFADELLTSHVSDRLTEVYRDWLTRHVNRDVTLDAAASLFPLQGRTDLLDLFLRYYDRLAVLYNDALRESGSELRPLSVKQGELPYFAVLDHEGHRVRTGVYFDGGRVRVGTRTFDVTPDGRAPLEALADAGVRAIPPKAVLLVVQVRTGPNARALALPYQGSLYIPAAHCLSAKLADEDLLPEDLQPVVRVRFRLLDRMRSIDTPIRLPKHLAAAIGEQVIPARRLADAWEGLAADAGTRLKTLSDPDGRQQWQESVFPDLTGELTGLSARRRELAVAKAPSGQLRELGQRAKALKLELLDRTIRQIDRDWQVRNLDYWDSRGALLPWCVALGGIDFYNAVISEAEVYEESPRQDP